ncbi:hypothetical protein KI387_005628, partial [Taxus chinensis]
MEVVNRQNPKGGNSGLSARNDVTISYGDDLDNGGEGFQEGGNISGKESSGTKKGDENATCDEGEKSLILAFLSMRREEWL